MLSLCHTFSHTHMHKFFFESFHSWILICVLELSVHLMTSLMTQITIDLSFFFHSLLFNLPVLCLYACFTIDRQRILFYSFFGFYHNQLTDLNNNNNSRKKLNFLKQITCFYANHQFDRSNECYNNSIYYSKLKKI